MVVRHGETYWNAEGRCQGRLDRPMNDRGRRQVDALAESLRNVAIAAAYSSPLLRAAETAKAIARDVPVHLVPDLSELNYGALQGQRFADWPEEVLRQWEADPWSVTFPGGESLCDVRLRVSRAFRRIADAHRCGYVLISGHGHVNRVLLSEMLGLANDAFWRIAQPNTGTFFLTRDTVGWSAMPSSFQCVDAQTREAP